MTHEFSSESDCAASLDAADELTGFRQAFELPRQNDRTLTYLCGHSLGPLPREARRLLDAELERWSEFAVEGHFAPEGWLRYHERFAAPLARLTGSEPEEIVAMNTLTVNLHLMLVSFFAPTAERYKILIERDAFPSDRFAVESHLRWHDLDPAAALVEIAPEPGAWTLDLGRLEEVLAREGERIALLLLPGVQYLSGQALDVGALAALAHRYGCRIGFDLAHAIGNVPLALHEAGADFAVWCSYKYLNAGPGAVGGCYVHARWFEAELPRFQGWWGTREARRFDSAAAFSPVPGAGAWQLSNPPILSLTPLGASLAIFDEAGLASLRAKSMRLTSYLEYLIRSRLGDRARILTPRAPQARGCQLSLRLEVERETAARVPERLRAAGVVADWREPAVLRLAPAPLYNTFGEVYDAVRALEQALR
jgi:kynureninase